MEHTAAILCQNLTKRFDDLAVLRNVNLRVERGEFVTLVGMSGSGKSTLIRIIADLVEPTTGHVLVNGQSPRAAREGRGYGIVFQSPTLYGWRTVRENAALPLEIIGVDADEREVRTAEMLDVVGLTDFADAYPAQLSGGMQQRVALARALAYRPPLLLMDEPFGALDDVTRERLGLRLLRIQAQFELTVFFVTHHIDDAVFLADRVAVLGPRPGTIVAEVPVELPRPRTAETRQSHAFFDTMTRVRAALDG